jgi:excisionase family DNA binding protein
MTAPPNNAPCAGDPTAPASESPASVGSDRRRKVQPHHRPAATEFSAASDAMANLASAIRQLLQTEVAAQVAAALAERPAVAELLSTAEAARYAKVTPRSIRRWLDQGKLRALHAGRELRIRRADLDQLMRTGRRRKVEISPEALERELAGGD